MKQQIKRILIKKKKEKNKKNKLIKNKKVQLMLDKQEDQISMDFNNNNIVMTNLIMMINSKKCDINIFYFKLQILLINYEIHR